jgi:hypothetical protein
MDTIIRSSVIVSIELLIDRNKNKSHILGLSSNIKLIYKSEEKISDIHSLLYLNVYKTLPQSGLQIQPWSTCGRQFGQFPSLPPNNSLMDRASVYS